ncbi:hypothetical protein JYG23_04210 [Sedimentibacter sp. zth1]|uniref:hypothetical protein n=1 Tax=Sedimentibacter sp. zth1 TaxID=2816908 RepID=UPI001A924547|nr:hypothetical protein [Sedimentibacter sp. zth1]QSX06665.1 hypothetical protein JYG23_04210 [Sedimentibacter sp. zth1]
MLSSIQQICKDKGTEDIGIMTAWSEKRGWYTTTTVPQVLPDLMGNVECIIDYLGGLLEKNKLEVIQILSTKLLNTTTRDISEILNIKIDLVEDILKELHNEEIVKKDNDKWSITTKGWNTYIAISHITYNYTIKLDINKAFAIAEVFKKVFDKEYGEDLGMGYEEIIMKLKDTEEWEGLMSKGITEKDISQAEH